MHRVIRGSHLRWAFVLAATLTVAATTASLAASTTTGNATTSTAGVLRFVTSNPPRTFDPAYGAAFTGTFMDPVYEALIRNTPEGDPTVPGLALSWKIQRNGLLLKLRKGVKFSDGAPFNASVVKANVDRTKRAGGESGSRLKPVTGVKVIAPYTVLLQTRGPRPDLISSLTTAAGQMVSPRAFNSPDLGRRPVGAGPYMLDVKATVPDSKYVYVKNPYYFDKKQQGVDRLELITIQDESQRINAVKSGQADAGMIGSGEEYRAYKSAGFGVKMATGDLLVLVVVTPTGAWAKQGVRQALGFAIDRVALQNSVYKDFGVAAKQVFSRPGTLGYLAKPPFVFDYDAAKAKQLLEAAGGPPPAFKLPTLPWKTDETMALAGFLNAVGFQAGMEVVSPNQHLPMIHAGKFPVAMIPLFEENAAQFADSIAPHGYLNPKGIWYNEVQKLAHRAAAASVDNPKLSAQLYGKMMAKLASTGIAIPVIQSSNGVAYTNKVQGMQAYTHWYTGTSLRGVRVTG